MTTSLQPMVSFLDSLYLPSTASSRSITAENPDGRPGGGGRATDRTTLHAPSARAAERLGPGWKMSPCRRIGAGERVTLVDLAGPGVIRHVWMTLDPRFYRDVVLEAWWDHDEHPSVRVPVGDLFCCPPGPAADLSALPVAVNPTGGLNLYLPMPFGTHARIAVTNEGDEDVPHLFYQVDLSLEPVQDESLRFHALYRSATPLAQGDVYWILDGVEGAGRYTGTFVTWRQRSDGWWGEGEVKMYLDSDTAHPTICGTGTEDYFGGAWCFGRDYSTPFLGYRRVQGEAQTAGALHAMYRFHVADPVHFSEAFRCSVQALGWTDDGRFRPLADDITSVAYWYQRLPHRPLPALPPLAERRSA